MLPSCCPPDPRPSMAGSQRPHGARLGELGRVLVLPVKFLFFLSHPRLHDHPRRIQGLQPYRHLNDSKVQSSCAHRRITQAFGKPQACKMGSSTNTLIRANMATVMAGWFGDRRRLGVASGPTDLNAVTPPGPHRRASSAFCCCSGLDRGLYGSDALTRIASNAVSRSQAAFG